MGILKFTDALELIQRAEASIASNTPDTTYAQMLDGLVVRFKGQLSLDHDLPVEFFDSVDVTTQSSEEIPAELSVEPQDYELTLEAQKLYNEIEMSI